MPRSVFVHSCHVKRLFLSTELYTIQYPLISRGIVASVRGATVNLFPIQFVLNFVGDDQKCYSIENGTVTRWYSNEI